MSTFKDGLIDALHMACEMERESKDQPIEHAIRKTQTWALARMIDATAAIEHIVAKAKQNTK